MHNPTPESVVASTKAAAHEAPVPPAPTTEEWKSREQRLAEHWTERNKRTEAESQAWHETARRQPVYLAKGPIIGAILIANLITLIAWAILYSLITPGRPI